MYYLIIIDNDEWYDDIIYILLDIYIYILYI